MAASLDKGCWHFGLTSHNPCIAFGLNLTVISSKKKKPQKNPKHPFFSLQFSLQFSVIVHKVNGSHQEVRGHHDTENAHLQEYTGM